MAVKAAECPPLAGASCTEQSSSTTAADGTITKTDNYCFSDGSKNLEVTTYPPGSNTASNQTVQILKNGAICSSVQTTTTRSSDAAFDTIVTTTDVIMDGAGNVVATTVSVTNSGTNSRTQTITCAGQDPEPLDVNCLYGGIFSCGNGSCM